MIYAICQIDRFYKRLYQLDTKHHAHDFLIRRPLKEGNTVDSMNQQGALYLVDRGHSKDLNLGIYLHPSVLETLNSFKTWRRAQWSLPQLQAFCVAAEEVSHFNFLLYHVERGESISQFHLELQGEIDKFLATLFTLRMGNYAEGFVTLYERLFFQFRLAENLNPSKEERYLDANRYARRYILNLRSCFEQPKQLRKALKELRHFYRLGPAEKISRVSVL